MRTSRDRHIGFRLLAGTAFAAALLAAGIPAMAGEPQEQVQQDQAAPTAHVYLGLEGSAGGVQSAVRRSAAEPWESVGGMPSDLAESSAAGGDGKVYSAGGYSYTGGGHQDAAYVFDLESKSWTDLPDMQQTRYGPGAAYTGGKFYALGGLNSSYAATATGEVYDPATDSWTSVADMPTAVNDSGTAVVDGQIYLVAGCVGSGTCGSYDGVQVYDIATDTWSEAASYPEALGWVRCGAIEGKIYCAGGSTSGRADDASAYVYDPATDAWTEIAGLSKTVFGPAGSVANGKLVLSSGEWNRVISGEGYEYDPATDAWTAIPEAAVPAYTTSGACGFLKIGGATGHYDLLTDVELLPGYDACE